MCIRDRHNAGSETYGVHTAAGDVTDDGRLCIRGVSFASEEDTGEDIIYPVSYTHLLRSVCYRNGF